MKSQNGIYGSIHGDPTEFFAATAFGGTTINGGMLQARTPDALSDYDTPGEVVVTSGCTVGVNVGGTGRWLEANIDDLISNASFASWSSLGIDTTYATSGFTYEGAMTGAFGLKKLGDYMLTLMEANTYSSGTLIYRGNLCVMGSIGNVNVYNRGMLSGTGTVGYVNVHVGGGISPGDNGGSGIGTLYTGSLQGEPGATYYAQLANNSPASDAIDVTGAVTLEYMSLKLSGSRTRLVGEALMLILNDGVDDHNGTFEVPFSGEGATTSLNGVEYELTYHRNGNDIALVTL